MDDLENKVNPEKAIPLVELIDLTKDFNGSIVLRGINLEIFNNEFVTLLGPSGCGKTTTLRIIGGFETPSSGKVLFSGKDIGFTPAYRRPTNTVFQRYALFPHLSVQENIAYGPRRYYHNKKHQEELIDKLLIEYVQEKDNNDWPYKKYITFKNNKAAEDFNNWHKSEEFGKNYDYHKTISIAGKTVTIINYLKQSCNLRKRHLINLFIIMEVKRLLRLVNLEGFEERGVTKLSGGQQQRVAIARALINKPRLLLLDEPLGALDLKLRQEMQYELKEIQRKTGITFIYVTHDQEEALTMSDKIVVMKEGEILQVGSPQEIYNEPVNRFVAKFIGESNIIEGIYHDEETVMFDGKKFKCIDSGFTLGQNIDIVIRPEDLEIVYPSKGKLLGVVDSVVFKGVHYETNILTDIREYTVHTTKYYPVGRQVGLNFTPEDLHIMEPSK